MPHILLTAEEARLLANHFMTIGYIHYDNIELHQLITKILTFVELAERGKHAGIHGRDGNASGDAKETV